MLLWLPGFWRQRTHLLAECGECKLHNPERRSFDDVLHIGERFQSVGVRSHRALALEWKIWRSYRQSSGHQPINPLIDRLTRNQSYAARTRQGCWTPKSYHPWCERFTRRLRITCESRWPRLIGWSVLTNCPRFRFADDACFAFVTWTTISVPTAFPAANKAAHPSDPRPGVNKCPAGRHG
jgi:hypothetical protein